MTIANYDTPSLCTSSEEIYHVCCSYLSVCLAAWACKLSRCARMSECISMPGLCFRTESLQKKHQSFWKRFQIWLVDTTSQVNIERYK